MNMLTRRLTTLLKIRAEERKLVALVAALFATIEVGRNVSGSAADALFFARFGVEYLPYLYIFLGVLGFLATLTYSAFLGRVVKGRFFAGLLIGFAVVLLIERAAIGFGLSFLYPVMWLSVNIIGALLGTIVWTTAGDVCDARQAKRLFPLFVGAGIFGGLLGSLITGPAATLFGTDNLLVIVGGLLLASMGLLRKIASTCFKAQPETNSASRSNFIADVRAGFDAVRLSPMMTRVGISAVLFSILYFTVSFPFGKAVSTAYSNEAELAGFLGLFSGISSVVALLAALLVANRLYARIGVVNALLLLPITYLIGFIVFGLNFSFVTAVGVRLAQLVVLSGIGDGAYGTFFNTVPSEKRAQVRAFDSGVPSQIGTILSGLLLILGAQFLNASQIFVMGVIVALACALVIWQMRRLYANALVEALRTGNLDVFRGGERAFVGFQGDAAALRILGDALRDAKPSRRRLAAEMLGKLGAVPLTPELKRTLSDADPDVRVAALNALLELDALEDDESMTTLLHDSDAAVRTAVLHALAMRRESLSSAISADATHLLVDADPSVRAAAAQLQLAFGQPALGLAVLRGMLQDAQPELRQLALSTFREAATSSLLAETPRLIAALNDAVSAVRREACAALGAMRDPAGLDALIGHISDPDETVRLAAAQATHALGGAFSQRLLDVLHHGNFHAREAALVALPTDDATQAMALREVVREDIQRLKQSRTLAAAIPTTNAATRLLHASLLDQMHQQTRLAAQVIGRLGRSARQAQTDFALIGQNLTSNDAELRAAAIEALESLGDRDLSKELISLLDAPVEEASRTDSAPVTTMSSAVAQLLNSDNAWLRALAVRTSSELNLNELWPIIRTLTSDPDALVRDAANETLSTPGENMPMLQTASLMERILLLREVPLFAGVSAEDLKQIAELAHERRFADGAIVCQQGEPGHELFLVLEGKLQVIKHMASEQKLIATLGPGECVGEMAVFESLARYATVKAEGEALTLVLAGDVFKSILHDRPDVALAVLRTLSRRLRNLN